ncbi:hypothetical protein GCM10009093_27650 [Brevundimonas terrae]|uniref:Uncharacterized protein n=1 Tax=Brevundimonas terrae TaxID=363631 RepID=A0ABP3IEA1_9CAUL
MKQGLSGIDIYGVAVAGHAVQFVAFEIGTNAQRAGSTGCARVHILKRDVLRVRQKAGGTQCLISKRVTGRAY